MSRHRPEPRAGDTPRYGMNRMKAVLQRRVTSIRWTELFIIGAENLTFHHGSNIQTYSILRREDDDARYDMLKPLERKQLEFTANTTRRT